MLFWVSITVTTTTSPSLQIGTGELGSTTWEMSWSGARRNCKVGVTSCTDRLASWSVSPLPPCTVTDTCRVGFAVNTWATNTPRSRVTSAARGITWTVSKLRWTVSYKRIFGFAQNVDNNGPLICQFFIWNFENKNLNQLCNNTIVIENYRKAGVVWGDH